MNAPAGDCTGAFIRYEQLSVIGNPPGGSTLLTGYPYTTKLSAGPFANGP
jgi:hypothetical protein